MVSHPHLYSFGRLTTFFASECTATQAAEAAAAFGQDDDITVLTVTRLSAYRGPSTERGADELAPSLA